MGYEVIGGKLVKTHKSWTRGGKRLTRAMPEMAKPKSDNEGKRMPANKGLLGGACNRSACLSVPALFYNHSTRKYYCTYCALELNRVNRDAIELFGHDLCLMVDDISEIKMADYVKSHALRAQDHFTKPAGLKEVPGKGWIIDEEIVIDEAHINPKAVAEGGLVNMNQQQLDPEGAPDDNQH